MKVLSKNVQCPKNIHIRAVAAQMQIIFQLNIILRIVSIIQTEQINLHFYSFIVHGTLQKCNPRKILTIA